MSPKYCAPAHYIAVGRLWSAEGLAAPVAYIHKPLTSGEIAVMFRGDMDRATAEAKIGTVEKVFPWLRQLTKTSE